MKKISIAMMALLSIAAVACKGKKEQTDAETAQGGKREVVKVLPLESRKIAHSVEHTANIMAFEEVHMAPASPGRIENIFVEVGSRVGAGTLLVQMDRTQLHQAEVQLRTLETDFHRLDTLQKTGSVSRQQFDQIKAQYEIARNNVDFLRQNTALKAPFSGLISGKYFEAGEMFSGAPNTQAGKAAVVSLVQIDKVKAMVSVSEKYFPFIKIGMPVNITLDLYPGKTVAAKVFRIHPTLDMLSRTFTVEVEINNASGELRPGMFARVNFDLEEVEAFVIPAIAVLKMQGSNVRYLFVAENGKARRVDVTIGKRFDDFVEVISEGVKPGDNIIISGQARLLDGTEIEILKD